MIARAAKVAVLAVILITSAHAQTASAPASPVTNAPAAPPPTSPAAATASTPASADEHMLDLMAPLPTDAVAWPTLANTVADDVATPAVEADLRYTVELVGMNLPGLTAQFDAASLLHKGRNEPSNIAQIRRRTAADMQLMDELLHADGHYGGSVQQQIIAPTRTSAPTVVRLTVDTGPLYHFSRIDLATPKAADLPLVTRALGLAVGAPVVAVTFNTAQEGMRAKLAAAAHPFPEIGDPDIVIDHASRSALLTQKIDPGPLGRFGTIHSEGNVQITARHMARMVRFKEGDLYDGAEIEDLRRALIATNLYGSVTIRPVNAGTNPDGSVRVDLVVTGDKAPLRTVSITAGYSTGEGIRLEGSWQNRNMFPPQGAVTFNGVLAQREQAIGAELRRRNWLQRDRTLVLTTSISTQQQDAYNATSTTVGASVERETNLIWQKKVYYSIGASFTASNETDLSQTTAPDTTAPATLYYIISVPMSLTYDGSDDLLNPVKGFRLTGRASPELSFQSGSFGYVRAQIEGSYYQPVASNTSIAARLHFGSIIGATRGDIAPSRRFYAGGGGSVRGYSYQQVGPKDANGVPTGGNSLTEASIEARVRFGNWGVVPFVDAGQVFASTVPSFDSLRIGAGIGVRYYTSFGPIRFDVATPINPQPGDSKFNIYVSIGQAF
jgi:translocation and assembly module TamA